MIHGYPPFSDENNLNIYRKILTGQIFNDHKFLVGPSFTCIVTSEPLQWRHSVRTAEERLARDLVRRLLVRDTTQRLGCMKRSTLDVTEHKFYDTLDWDEVSLEFHFRI